MSKKKAEGQEKRKVNVNEAMKHFKKALDQIPSVPAEDTARVRNDAGDPEDVKGMADVELYDLHRSHTQFVISSIIMINEACMSGDRPDEVADHIPTLLCEAETRLEYIKVVGEELHRRIREAGKEKAA